MSAQSTEAAAQALVEKFLHPRLTAEHIFSGGGTCLTTDIQPMMPGKRFAGRALTVRTLAGFTRKSIEALAKARKGDVLVIAAGGKSELSVWGGMVHWNATRIGVAGIVIDGMSRDYVEIEGLEGSIPIFCRGRAPAIAGFGTPTSGSVGDAIVCGGVSVNTGDLIFGDDDGVVVVPWAKAEEVLDLAMKSIVFDDKEQAWVESGRTIYDMLVMLSGADGSQYKDRKFRWVSQDGIEPLAD